MFSYFSKIRNVYEIMSKNMAEPERPQMTTRRMRFACLLATNTHSDYVILTAFPLQQWLRNANGAKTDTG
jgi:hypothetical protein